MSTLREIGRQEWTGRNEIDQIKTGAIQRIADACEIMAKNHGQIIEERDRYKRWYEDECKRRQCQDRQISGLRGRITFLLRKEA